MKSAEILRRLSARYVEETLSREVCVQKSKYSEGREQVVNRPHDPVHPTFGKEVTGKHACYKVTGQIVDCRKKNETLKGLIPVITQAISFHP